MNLGTAKLQSVNVSRPQLLQSLSKRSIAVTEDYHSFSDYVSDASSLDERTSTVRWETPLSQVRLTNTSQEKLQSEMTLPMTKTAKRQRADTPDASSIVRFDERRINRGPSTRAPSVRSIGNHIHPPTPGLDDSPYIRFAIEQLTRDEELTGERRQGDHDSLSSYSVERMVPDEGLGYYSPGQERNEEWRRERIPSPRQGEASDKLNLDYLIPVENPVNVMRHPRLGFLPFYLRFQTLSIIVLSCLLMIGALVFCVVWSERHDGLWEYTGPSGRQFFVFKYLPQLLAILIILALFVVETAIHRVIPFKTLASQSAKSRSNALFMDLFPTNFILPKLAYFKAGQPLIAICLISFWLSVFTIPLQSAVFQAPFPYFGGQGSGRWTTVQPVAWALVAIYGALAISLILMGIYLSIKSTGLKWDPTTLADLIALLHRSNSVQDYDHSEILTHSREFRSKLKSRSDRLGYWRTSQQPDNIFYAIGEEGAPIRRYSLQQGKVTEKTPERSYPEPFRFDIECQRRIESSSTETHQSNIHSPFVRYRFIPWFLKDTCVIAWIVIALVLLIAFLVVSFVRHAVQNGFQPLLNTSTNADGFPAAGFLYNFLPSLLGLLLFLFWQSIDMRFRALQPFANLANPQGTTAEESLLLDYAACLPIEVTIKAFIAGHHKVAWFSMISLISIALPVLGGGLFYSNYTTRSEEVRIVAFLPAFYILIAFLIIYALSFLFIWPTRKRYLPHDITTLAKLISFVYQSPILQDVAFREPRTKTDLVTRVLNAPLGEKVKARYAFGIYRGRDGFEHLGIDRLQRPGREEMLVTTGTMR
ncbi:MAG: hypothetical protein M1827_007435 [Pycnora praestabilis]|nr:MAG: hypothetical protein M1827_007435 [Pycnora praestabilis]